MQYDHLKLFIFSDHLEAGGDWLEAHTVLFDQVMMSLIYVFTLL